MGSELTLKHTVYNKVEMDDILIIRPCYDSKISVETETDKFGSDESICDIFEKIEQSEFSIVRSSHLKELEDNAKRLGEAGDSTHQSTINITQDGKDFLKECTGVLEINNNELYGIYKESLDNFHYKRRDPGKIVSVGQFHGFDVCISVWVVELYNDVIACVSPASNIVNWHKIDDWLNEQMPDIAFKDGRLNKEDASDWRNVLSGSND